MTECSLFRLSMTRLWALSSVSEGSRMHASCRTNSPDTMYSLPPHTTEVMGNARRQQLIISSKEGHQALCSAQR